MTHWTQYARGAARRPPGTMTKLERAYAERLDALKHAGEVLWWVYESVNLKIGEGAWFKADFFVMKAGGELEVHEAKGFWAEAARVRIKVAASLYPFRFIAVTYSKREGWKTEEFSDG